VGIRSMRTAIAGLLCVLSAVGYGCASNQAKSTVTVTATATSAEARPGRATVAAAPPSQANAAPNNPAKLPDPNAPPCSAQVTPGQACVPGTTSPSSPNQFPQRNCDTNIVANSATSCGLAENAFYEYYATSQAGGSTESMQVYSPGTHKDYLVGCTPQNGLVECYGPDLASGIYLDFPTAAVSSYSQADASAYAASHDVGNSGPAPQPSGPVPPVSTNGTGAGADFCSTHSCIPTFANGTGYIVQCADGEWSQSGGRPGACSDHGGETSRTYP
jgi:hypothetical protein